LEGLFIFEECKMSKQKAGVPFSLKIAFIALVMASTLGYSIIRKRMIDDLTSSKNFLILKNIPEFSFKRVPGYEANQEPITSKNVFDGNGSKALLVHFCGTWCGPCEAELPEFIEFAENLKDRGVKALLLAVNDDDKKIKKFMKRFGDLPENIFLVHDKSGSSMLKFGTVKVPETYLFSKSGKNLNKFIGPQDWKHSSYKKRMDFYLSSLNPDQNSIQK
jgi:cytochrome c biogenesis protein CcmG/thiol:disulfide interchange protein DsbE